MLSEGTSPPLVIPVSPAWGQIVWWPLRKLPDDYLPDGVWLYLYSWLLNGTNDHLRSDFHASCQAPLRVQDGNPSQPGPLLPSQPSCPPGELETQVPADQKVPPSLVPVLHVYTEAAAALEKVRLNLPCLSPHVLNQQASSSLCHSSFRSLLRASSGAVSSLCPGNSTHA